MKEFALDIQKFVSKNKKLFVVMFAIAIGIATALMIVASFLDYQISVALYNSSQLYSRIFEYFGEWPAYAIYVGFPISLFVWLVRTKRYWWSPLAMAYALGFGFFFVRGVMFPVTWQNLLFNTITIVSMLVVFFKIEEKNLFKIMFLLLIAFIITQVVYLLMLLVKAVWGRVRFRDIYCDYAYTDWWVINGINGHEAFFSGHVLAALSLAFIWLLPALFNIKNKFALWSIILIPIWYSVSMMYARIAMGAHYLSDVAFSVIILSVFTIGMMKWMFVYANKNGRIEKDEVKEINVQSENVHDAENN